MIGAIILGIVGIAFLLLGYFIGIKENISLLHGYHRHKVHESNKRIFCRLCGIGVAVDGIGMLITAIIFGITAAWSFILFGVSFLAGLSLMIYAVCKYNR